MPNKTLVCGTLCFLIAFGGAYGAAVAAPGGPNSLVTQRPDPRIVRPSRLVDADGDRINDHLAAQLTRRAFVTVGPPAEQIADLIVALDHAPIPADVQAIAAAGGQVLDTWSELIYAVRVALPASNLAALLQVPGVTLVEENKPVWATLYLSTRQVRARQVWSPPYALQGDGTHNIAVLDTGIDDTHPDLVDAGGSKVIDWTDLIGARKANAGDEYLQPADKMGHGSHVAGIAGGLGTSGGTSSGTGTIATSYFGYFPSLADYGYPFYFPVDTTGATGNKTITGRLKWSDRSSTPGRYVYLDLFDDADNWLDWNSASSTASQPLVLTYSSVAPGIRSYSYWLLPTKNWNGASAYWVQSTSPMTAVGDGFNLMRGVAPGADLVGIKVLDDLGDSDQSIVMNGLTWMTNHKAADSIVVANLSLGWPPPVNATFDAAINNAVAAGIVVCIAAGNGRRTTDPNIYSPGSASKAITAVATSELDRVTDYSSYGATGTSKPDLAAPGGSVATYRSVTSIDSNDGEYYPGASSTEAFPNDYASKSGTSMACPHVAGAAALVAQAMGTWNWTENEALRVKMYLEMTATETNQAAEPVTGAPTTPPDPVLNRGAKDVSEGFGRLNTDAAIEAVTMAYNIGNTAQATFGPLVTDKKCWARRISLGVGVSYTFTLANPAGSDYDLYLYRDSYTNDGSTSLGSIGDPIIATSSCSAGNGGTEQIPNWICPTSGTYYVVVKRVAGNGVNETFTLTSSSTGSVLAVSVTPTGWTLGTIKPGDPPPTTWTNTTPASGGYFTATNEGSGPEDLTIKVADTHASPWTPGPAPGAGVFTMEWGQTQTQGNEPTWNLVDADGEPLTADLGAGGHFAFDLRFRAPTSEDPTEHTIMVTVMAQP